MNPADLQRFVMEVIEAYGGASYWRNLEEKGKIFGFGNFITREKQARKGRNPKTGEGILISGRRVLTFKPSAMLRKAVNQRNHSSEKIEIQE